MIHALRVNPHHQYEYSQHTHRPPERARVAELKKGVDIIISTPGRFLDLYLEGNINTQFLKFLVMDEADKMMDMGFIGSIHRILEVVPRKRQNLLFSATMSELVHKI